MVETLGGAGLQRCYQRCNWRCGLQPLRADDDSVISNSPVCSCPDADVCACPCGVGGAEFDHQHNREEPSSQNHPCQAPQDNIFYDGRKVRRRGPHVILCKISPQEINPRTRPAEDRLRARPHHPDSANPRALPQRRARRHMEPGQRRRHAPLPGRSWLADQGSSRLTRVDQLGPWPKQRSFVESRKRHDHRTHRSRQDHHTTFRPKRSRQTPIVTAPETMKCPAEH